MRFGRVYGFVVPGENTERWLTVVLDTGKEVRTIRDEVVSPNLAMEDPGWLADQLVQETIGNELATEGWEVVGEGSDEDRDPTAVEAIATSPVWIVRNV